MRGLEKNCTRWRRHTDRHLHGHGDTMTNSAQWGRVGENPTKGDWVSSVKKTISEIDLNMNFEEIKMTKKNFFKKLLNKKINIVAFRYLILKVKSKEREIVYQKILQCQTYLMPNNILRIQEQRSIFSFRTRMNHLKNNYEGN